MGVESAESAGSVESEEIKEESETEVAEVISPNAPVLNVPNKIKRGRGRPKGSKGKKKDRIERKKYKYDSIKTGDIIPNIANVGIDGVRKTEFQKSVEAVHGRNFGKIFQPGKCGRKAGVQPITEQQKRFLREFAKCGKKREALDRAGYKNRLHDTTTANYIIKKHPREFVEIMEAHGLNDDLLVISIKEGLEATKPIVNNLGAVVSREPAMDTRHKYLDTALKVKGRYAPEKVLTIQANVNIAADKVKDLSEKELDDLLVGKEILSPLSPLSPISVS